MAVVYPQPLLRVSGAVVAKKVERWEGRPAVAAEPPSPSNPQGRRGSREVKPGTAGVLTLAVSDTALEGKRIEGGTAYIEVRTDERDLNLFGDGELVELYVRSYAGMEPGASGSWRNVVKLFFVDRVTSSTKAA